MLHFNFLAREQLGELGLSKADIDAFIELRMRLGEVLPHEISSDKFSSSGLAVLRQTMEEDSETERRLSKLSLMLYPVPPIATMEPMTVTVLHHGNIDRELRVLETSFLPHGPMPLRIFDISLEHIIKIEVRASSGELVYECANIPFGHLELRGGSSIDGEENWRHLPPLQPGESWSPDGVEIYARLFIDTHTKLNIEPITPEPQFNIARAGRFIVPGQPDFRFDSYTLAFGFPSELLFSKLPNLFGDGMVAHVAQLQAADPLINKIAEFITLELGAIDFNGFFDFKVTNRPELEASGWAWVLTGPTIFVGFQPDQNLYEPRPEMLITLPSGKQTSETRVPYNITERGLLDRPELFGGDPGLDCRPFDQPGRILGERRFQTALRVTQPFVDKARRETITFEDITKRPIDFPREHVTETNPVEYESDNPAFYQAKSVAIGHILETVVRYRSNGYSLGDIAYSLTLAPRQKRRIIKIDFSRSERARRLEFTRAEDEVADAVDSSRSYDNAVAASLDEWAKGRSQSGTTSAAAAAGFSMPGFVASGGVSTSSSTSSSSQSGGRQTAASETQQINDAIRRFGESIRAQQSTVMYEAEQKESVEGVSEVVQNINYTRSLSVVYYEILRHLRVDTEVAGVTECVYVPMPVRIFTDERIKRHKDVLARYARTRWEQLAFRNLEFLPARLNQSDIPSGERADHVLTVLSGSFYIRVGLEMPGEGDIAAEIDLATDKTISNERIAQLYRRSLSFFTPYLPVSISQIVLRTSSASPAERNRYFQQEIAPHMARRYMDDLRLLDGDETDLEADFTMATDYSYGRTIQVDFTVDLSGRHVTRRHVQKMRVTFNDQFFDLDANTQNPNRYLPPRSFMDVVHGVINYGNDLYEERTRSDRGMRDLVNSVNGHAERDGALINFKLSHADTRNLHELLVTSYNDFKARLNARPFFYHKAIWWRMDRDELYALLDGYSFNEGEGRSLASIVEHRPLGILGNTLVFKVTTDAPLDSMFTTFSDLKNHYIAGLPPRDPIRISLPTEGLYARAHMDGCVAAEEHNGSFDWVFDNQEPELADLPASLLESRRAQPPDLTPTPFPNTIINLQNAPSMPAPSGLQGALGAVQNAGAFRDMAGLSGTQANTSAGLQTAAGLATSFGDMAFQGAIAQLQADSRAAGDLKGIFSAIEKARDSGLITPEQASQAALDVIARRMGGKDTAEEQHRREIEKQAMETEGGGTITKTTKDGTETIIKNPPPQPKAEEADSKPQAKPVGHVRWLEGERGRQDLLLYNFGVGKDDLHPAHKKALTEVSVQIKGVADIAGVEGRASSTLAQSDDELRQNDALSQRRMERVWQELMRYAMDPQSNLDRQLILSDSSPVRDRYPNVLDDIPKGHGDEDPVERSVLIRLARRVQTNIEPIPIPEKPGVPLICTYGHTVQIQDASGDMNSLVNQNGQINSNQKTLIEGDQISAGNDVMKVSNVGNNNITFTSVFKMPVINMFFPSAEDAGGTQAKVEYSSKPTHLWTLRIAKPRVTGSGTTEVFKLFKDALTTLKAVTETLPQVSLGASGELSIPTVAGAKASVSLSNLNPSATIGTFFEEVFEIVFDPQNTVGKTLNGLIHGTTAIDIELTARSPDNPADYDAAITRKGVVDGKGLYYVRAHDVTSENMPETVAVFEYETEEPFKISAWPLDVKLRDIDVEFWRGAILQDVVATADFLGDLLALLGSDALGNLVPEDAVKSISTVHKLLNLLKGLMESGEGLTFKPHGQPKKTVTELKIGDTLTSFQMESGAFKFTE